MRLIFVSDVTTLRRASSISKSFPMRVSKPNLKLTFQKRRRQNSNCGRRHGHCRRHHRRRCGRRRRCRTHYRRPCRRRQLKQCLATGPFFTPGDQEILGQLLLDFETRIMTRLACFRICKITGSMPNFGNIFCTWDLGL